ncbi:MAG: hypothetical protein ABI772_01540 [Bacteroidota bacterium]
MFIRLQDAMLAKNYFAFGVLLCLFITISSCNKRATDSDNDTQDLKINFSRFEKDLFSKENGTPQILRKKHGSFADLILKKVIGLRGENDSLLALEITQYRDDKYISEVYHQAEQEFKITTDIENGLQNAFSNYHELFPGKIIPEVKTFIAPFNYNTIATDSVLGIGLDMYLGSGYKYYPTAGFPLFKIRRLSKEYIVSDAVAAWLQSDYPTGQDDNNLLKNIIHDGKIWYALDRLLPDESDTIKFGFSKDQWEWCEKNELNIWQFFIQNKLLYNANTGEYIKFINDGATTSGFPKDAPSKLGTFIGLKIVQSFMQKNSGVTLQQLMNRNDADKILIDSGYKPEK